MAYQVFVSHTQKDVRFCDEFDRVCAGIAGIWRFRSEFEDISPPAWLTIREAMRKSRAMFLLVGPELVASQASLYEQETWEYTQNWIAYEVGLACQLGIDVWVVCDKQINFPVPYFNNYAPFGLGTKVAFDYMKSILMAYSEGTTFPYPYQPWAVECPNNNCRVQFNLHYRMRPGGRIICPQCLGMLKAEHGFGLEK